MKHNTILFQLPGVSGNSITAVSIWTRNMAQAFNHAGIKATIQFISRIHMEPRLIDGVKYVGIPLMHEWMLHVPKLKSKIVPVIQNYSFRYLKEKNGLVCALRGPFCIDIERKKLIAVRESGMTYLHSIMEHPSVVQKGKVSDYLNAMANEYDILMPISTRLRDLYVEYGRKKPIFLNPIITKMQHLSERNENDCRRNRILIYAGNLMHGEEMHILLESYAIINNKYKNTILKIYGGCTTELLQKYKKLCSKMQILGSVHFIGNVKHDEILLQYEIADILLLPRPFREYSRSGFPIKLGEYLASGNAVVTTGTGDIPLYLKDNESAYIVSNATPEEFARRVIDALGDRRLREIGIKGLEVARTHFSIEATAKRIEGFFGGV